MLPRQALGKVMEKQEHRDPHAFPRAYGLVAPLTFPSSTVGCPSFSGEGGLRPLVLLQTQGTTGPGQASLVLTVKGAMAGWQRQGLPRAVKAGLTKPYSA